jgi:type II secretory pathway pseudopilin PulG
MIHLIHRISKIFGTNEKGFTLIDLIIGVAITGIISLGATTSIIQVVQGNHDNRNHMTAIEHIQNAGYWISRDAMMAQEAVLGADEDSGFPLILKWGEYDSDDEHEVVYDIMGNSLERQEYFNRDTNPDPVASTLITENVDLSGTSFTKSTSDDGKTLLTLEITAKAVGMPDGDSQTEIFHVVLRPDPQ